MIQIAVVVTCHNRRPKTVACLAALKRAVDLVDSLHLAVFLTDDGSTDGTADAVQAVGLDVTVLPGSGNLFWNRGMVRAWEAAIESGQTFCGYLLLNDDTIVDEDALRRLLDTNESYAGEAVVVGATRDPATGEHTYGGVRRTSAWHPARVERVGTSTQPQEVDTFNANCVLVPHDVYRRVGMLDPTFTHGIGDFDYGLRARRAGVTVVVSPGTVGSCARNDLSGTWRDPLQPFRRRLRLLESPKGLPRHEWRAYLQRHGAPGPALLAWMPTLRVLMSSFVQRIRMW